MRRREPEEERDEPRPDGEDLEARIDRVTSAFERPPSPEELRAAFSRKSPGREEDERGDEFSKRFPTETLFSPTFDDADEEIREGEDRSRTRGDYYYDPDDAWAVLGVRPGASWPEIAAAHRRLAMKHHPDRLLDQSAEERARSEAIMRDVNVAYTVLRRLTGH